MKFLFSILFICISYLSQAQCGNVDFELGNFTGWTGTLGTCCPINLPGNGIVGGRQTIMSGAGTDANTCNVVPFVSPSGGIYSARLGNDINGAQAEGLSYSFVVTPLTALFTYEYAVVFQDPGHIPADQPRFESQVLDPSGVPIACTIYSVTSGAGIAGFQTCNGFVVPVRYKNWSSVAVILSTYMGQTVTAQFKTGDCNLGGHYGYAYLDGITCQPLEITGSYCVGDMITLTAPNGFSAYLWDDGQTTQTVTIDPTIYPNINCTVISFAGCNGVITSTYTVNPNPLISSISHN